MRNSAGSGGRPRRLPRCLAVLLAALSLTWVSGVDIAWSVNLGKFASSDKSIGAGFFSGEGFILQRPAGDGMVFIHAGGTVIEKELYGETLCVDTGCLVAFQPSIDYDIERAGNLKSMVFSGEDLFLATLKGKGKVWLQSLPFARMAGRIAVASGGDDVGEDLSLVGRLLGD